MMMPEGVLMEEVKLANGLSLFIYDQSRPLAGDRWLVKLLLFVPIKIRPEHFSHLHDANRAYVAFVAAMGGDIAMQQPRSRNFISHKDMPETLMQIKQDILTAILPYVSNPDFEARFIAKRYGEWCEEQRLERAQLKPFR
jgi:hypothetical protein